MGFNDQKTVKREDTRYGRQTDNCNLYERDIQKLVILERGDGGEVVILEGGGDEGLR